MSYCNWCSGSALMRDYHDNEWGIPVHDDVKQFEYLMMEAMQCGLSWSLMMKKREIFRTCFCGFDPERVAALSDAHVERILNTEGMIRSEGKVRAVINNAKCFLRIKEEYGSFSSYLWGFTKGKTLLYEGHAEGDIPVSNGLSDAIARDLKKRGFKYLGSITVYSHLQACGVINDHSSDCPCYKRINAAYPTITVPKDKELNVTHYD
ncbi:MAG: DNA-3-methyladenine glycosylase I [Clostridia bacterium]|nr:DNA-3-methyladenine glycosylase I [Clostridia bacterium]